MFSRHLAIPNLQVLENVPLSRYTRFEIGGPARVLADASCESSLMEGLRLAIDSGHRHTVIGGGTNLVVHDSGFPGWILRYTASAIEVDGGVVRVEAGAVLQDLVDRTVVLGLRGMETLTGIPGWVGGALYGNAGAYGHSIHECVESVRFFDGNAFREMDARACEFGYRESIFKRRKDWIIVAATLRLDPADPDDLRATADGILTVRNQKYPPTMRCAGSIFKNLMLAELPEPVRPQVPERMIREGKVPSAYFLEQAGVKGLTRGGIRVADYHANLVYNTGEGTAVELRWIIEELKVRVRDRFGIQLEEEVQHV
jgi:UDP-N-acetylmuramate dehydrogenase